ncbi:MAG: DUF3109 family protein [Chitinophagaceae bacterium]
MIVIDKILISDEIIEEQFVCDLNKCKGGCCEDGDSGAPLETAELDEVKKAFDIVKPFLTPVGLKELERTGLYRYDREFGWVTPTVSGEICAYGFRDKKGIIKCAFEEAYNQKLISWKKPVSCHLYPIRTKQSKYNDYQMMNYEPRETLCSPACELGKQLKVPVYQFLKESITRKFGRAFYTALEKIALEFYEKKK